MHAINLKRAWEAYDHESDAPAVRVDLPLVWSAIAWPGDRIPTLARLVRRFGRPPRSGSEDPPRLVFRGLHGVTAIMLNGEPIAWEEHVGMQIVRPGELLPRNVLAVVVDVERVASVSRPWGDLAILECGGRAADALGLPGGTA